MTPSQYAYKELELRVKQLQATLDIGPLELAEGIFLQRLSIEGTLTMSLMVVVLILPNHEQRIYLQDAKLFTPCHTIKEIVVSILERAS